MADAEDVQWHPPLKASVVEIIDLLSDDGSTGTASGTREHKKADASVKVKELMDDEDAAWNAPRRAPISRPSAQVQGAPSIRKVSESNEQRKAIDASAEESDSDDDSQWSLYEDALGEEEDEALIYGRM